MDKRVELKFLNTAVSPAKEITIIKEALEQATRDCSEMRGQREYVSIRVLANNRVYDRVEIIRMIKELP